MSASPRSMPWTAHSLCEPDVRLSKGEVSHSETSSIVLRTPPSCGLGAGCLAVSPPSGGASPFSVRVCRVEAWLVWLTANSPKDAITIRHVTIEPSPINLAIAEYTQLD